MSTAQQPDTYRDLVHRVNTALEARMASYPDRDQAYHDLCAILLEFADFLIQESETATHSESSIQPPRTDTPVFLCGSMKSGTTLLTQLLDGHPELFVMPGDSGFIQQNGKWPRTHFADIARHWIHRLVNPTGKRPFWFLGPDKESLIGFLINLRANLENTTDTVFSCVVHAISDLRNPNCSPRYWIEKNPHNELHVNELLDYYPNARFIHITRNPLENIASLQRNATVRGWSATPFERAHELKRLFQAGSQNRQRLGPSRYHMLRYEDIVTTPEQTMRELAEFLSIDYTESLLVPTEAGEVGMSNSMYESDRVTGQIADTSDRQRYLTELSNEEIRDIVTTLRVDAQKLGYDWSGPKWDKKQRSPLAQLVRHVTLSVRNRLRR